MPEGKLIAGEGLDGSGKTTVMHAVADHLRADEHLALVSNWNEARTIHSLTQDLTRSGEIDDRARILLAAAELAARWHYDIAPTLARDGVVIANKYLLSSLAHALARGCARSWVERVYAFARPADFTIYFDVDPQTALARKMRNGQIGFWETGLELWLDVPVQHAFDLFNRSLIAQQTVEQAFLRFQASLRAIHLDELKGRADVVWIDAGQDLDAVTSDAVAAVSARLT